MGSDFLMDAEFLFGMMKKCKWIVVMVIPHCKWT